VVRLPVDPWGDRCASAFAVRADVAEGLRQALAEVWSRGGVVTSSGSLRPPNAQLNAARSPVSLHYLGRAIDLCLWSGMQRPDDPYLILRDDSDADTPRWRALCTGDPGASTERTLEAMLWRYGSGTVPCRRTGSFFDLTALFVARSWTPIAARPGWRTDYAATEWWHFECHNGLVRNRSTFGDELVAVASLAEIAGTPLAGVLDHVWDGRRFVAPADVVGR
jgi:hypothetical protein